MSVLSDEEVLDRLATFRQYQADGRRAPHKPLLVLLALALLQDTGRSTVPWSTAETRLADLIAEFGPPSRTGRAQSAAYPFTRLRRDDIWLIDADVPDDNLTPLRDLHATGRLEPGLEQALRARPNLRSSAWPQLILAAWDRQCAFCGYDGQLAGSVVGIEAAHVRWFNLGGPDSEDNGMALCSLHHKLFDRGALGLDDDHRIQVSALFSARTDSAKAVYDLHDRPLRARRGTPLPGAEHVAWHSTQVFKGSALSA